MADLLNTLEAQVAEMMSGGAKGPPIISRVLPSDSVTTGDQLRIYGANFAFMEGGHSVFFGETRAITFLEGSSNTLLIVQVPDVVEGATREGKPLTMTVGNLHSSTSRVITIKAKPVVISGGFQFTYLGSRPTTPAQNAAINYDFQLRSFASEDLIVTLKPTIQVLQPTPQGVAAPQLTDRLTVLDQDGSEQPAGQIPLAEGTTKTISVRLNLPDGINGVRYNLTLEAGAPGVASVVEPVPPQQVGQESEQPDATVTNFEYFQTIAGEAAFSADAGGVAGVDGALTIPHGTTATILMRATFAQGDDRRYQLNAAVGSPASGWTVVPNAAMQNPVSVDAPGGSIDIFFDITASATPAETSVRLTLTREGAASGNVRSATYRLRAS